MPNWPLLSIAQNSFKSLLSFALPAIRLVRCAAIRTVFLRFTAMIMDVSTVPKSTYAADCLREACQKFLISLIDYQNTEGMFWKIWRE